MKKKILLNSLILGIASLPIVSLSASCEDLLLNQNQKANSDLELFVNEISKIDSSNKTELFFQSVEIDKSHALTNLDDFEKVFGVKIVVPNDIKVEITKNLFSKTLNVRVKNKTTTKNLQLEIKNFAPDTEYEKKLRNVIKEVQLINATDYDENVFKMRWLKDGNAKYNAVKTKFNDFDDDTPIGDELKTLAKNEMGLIIEPKLINRLEEIKGRQRFIIEKDYDTLDIKVTLVFSPSDVDYLFNGPNKVPGGDNDYYRIRVTPTINSFAVPATKLVDKLGILKKMLQYSQEYVSSELADDDYKALVLNSNSIDDVETNQYGKLVISDTIKNYLITNKLQMAISKATNTNLTKFDISTDAGDKDSVSFDVFGKFRAFREIFVDFKTPAISSTNPNKVSSRNFASMLLDDSHETIYIFGIEGAPAALRSYDTGRKNRGWEDFLIYNDYTVTTSPAYSSRFMIDDEYTTFVSGHYTDTEGVTYVSTFQNFSNHHFNAGMRTSESLKIDGVYTPRFILPTTDHDRHLVIIKKEDKNAANSPEGWYYTYLIYPFANPADNYYKEKVHVFENVLGEVKEIMLKTNNPEDGYIAVISNKEKTWVSYFNKDMRLISKNKDSLDDKLDNYVWNSDDTEFYWPAADFVKANDGGYWLAGKDGQVIYISKNGDVDKNVFINLPQKLASIVPDQNDGVFVGGENGYFAHIVRDKKLNNLKIDWERNIFRKQTILEIQKDYKGNLYLAGNLPKGGVQLEKLTPDGQKDAWEI